jgi:hypothetical protein
VPYTRCDQLILLTGAILQWPQDGWPVERTYLSVMPTDWTYLTDMPATRITLFAINSDAMTNLKSFFPRDASKVRGEVPVVDWAPRHEDVGGSSDTTLHILNLGARWRCLVSVTSRPLYPRENAPGTNLIQGLAGSRTGLDAVAKRKIPSPCWELNPGRPARGAVTVLAELPLIIHVLTRI